MNFAEKQALIERANKRRGAISDEKGPEYTRAADAYTEADTNVLANFYTRAERAEVSVFTVAQTYAGKHIDSLETALASLAAEDGNRTAQRATVEAGEGLLSRLDDLRNYCDLIECILVDEGLHEEADAIADDTYRATYDQIINPATKSGMWQRLYAADDLIIPGEGRHLWTGPCECDGCA